MDYAMYAKFSRMVRDRGIESTADYAKSLGFTSVEFFDFVGPNWQEVVPSLEDAKRYRAVLKERGLHVACYSVAVGLYDPSAPNGIDAHAEQKLMQYVDRAVALGSPFLHHTITLGVEGMPIPYKKMLATVLPAVVRVAKYAASCGIACLYEDQGLYFNGVEGFKGFFEAVRAEEPSVGICGDIGNVLFVDESPVDFFRAFAHEFRHVHIKDYVPCKKEDAGSAVTKGGLYIKEAIIGRGMIDTVSCLQILKEVGYAGAIAFENNHEEDFAMGVQIGMELVDSILI